MMTKTLIKNISVVNEGRITIADLLIDNGLIQKIGSVNSESKARVIWDWQV